MTTTLNEPLIRAIVARIEEDERRWDQNSWVNEAANATTCQTTYCFAGWAAVMTDAMVDGQQPRITDQGAVFSALMAKTERFYSPRIFDPYNAANFPYDVYGTKVLGLTEDQADILFAGSAGLPPQQKCECVDGPVTCVEDADWNCIIYRDRTPSVAAFKNLITEVTGIVFDEPAPIEPIAIEMLDIPKLLQPA